MRTLSYLPECDVMYTTSCPPVDCTELYEQHLIEQFLIAGDDVAGHVASAAKQAYDNNP
jgi:hypothetical protein